MKLMTTPFSLLSALGMAAFAVPGIAQGPGYQLDEDPDNEIKLGGPFSTVERVVFGHIAGFQLPGAVALVDGDVYGIYDPGAHNAAFVIEDTATVNDIDIVTAFEDDPAGILLACNDALWLYEWDSTTSTNPFTATNLAAGSYANLDLIRTGDIDGSGLEDLVGVKGSSVHLSIDSGSGWAHSTTITAGGTVHEAIVIDWDNNGSTQGHIAVLLDTKVEIWAHDGGTATTYSLAETFLGATSTGHLASLPRGGTVAYDRLAWHAPVNGAGDFLMLLSSGGARVNSGAFPFVPNAVLAAVHDDGADLLATQAGSALSRIYFPDGTTGNYTLTPPVSKKWNTFTNLLSADGDIAFGDISGDGVPDGLVASTVENDFYFFSGAVPAVAVNTPGGSTWSDPVLDGNHDQFRITVDVPNDTTGYTDWQMLVWRSEDGTELEAEAIANYRFALGTAGGTQDLAVDLAFAPTSTGGGLRISGGLLHQPENGRHPRRPDHGVDPGNPRRLRHGPGHGRSHEHGGHDRGDLQLSRVWADPRRPGLRSARRPAGDRERSARDPGHDPRPRLAGLSTPPGHLTGSGPVPHDGTGPRSGRLRESAAG